MLKTETNSGMMTSTVTVPLSAASTANVHAPAAATAAVITKDLVAGKRHRLEQVEWSYSAAPTGGNLKIEDGAGNVVFSLDITAAGPGFIPLSPAIVGTAGTAMIITLASGAGAVVGKVNARPTLEG
jgi:hypothetical protein